MSIQIVIADTPREDVSRRLGSIASRCEIFPMDDARIGLSIPEKLDADENWIHDTLRGLTYYDLYTGEWHGAE